MLMARDAMRMLIMAPIVAAGGAAFFFFRDFMPPAAAALIVGIVLAIPGMAALFWIARPRR